MLHTQQVKVLIVMGVAGSGKTTLARALVDGSILGLAEFLDADSFHSQSNIDKMSQGLPLTDQDRLPWLKSISTKMISISTISTNVQWIILACSCLKRLYRDTLCHAVHPIKSCIVYLECRQDIIVQRIQARQGHFAGLNLVQSQFDALEAPSPTSEPGTIVLDGSKPVDVLCQDLKRLFAGTQI
ncbi:hypothetical protein BATDEDRAFT_22554 [Batrachochytrium dendrobatidis JAM81]|uniref:Gluconokinase n=1 Tax=Batrachochytrium dendrobatidis (strain JAM81 / FGSC 10211) TaxID=684364 RepID=F4NV54_BATDJ|nr:gluconokinase [Batrachochytrium dendrobatidis JAM81]EGF83666.1 hypothetical protein BATDEDRAFT_22554 [Batrachochytrium dendrobatidis JAM81]|eukprot:XP_006675596.1 hypothetical protein BATDEDRAFT_22554 [Batrachochytrium dendrobatidis JAM81]